MTQLRYSLEYALGFLIEHILHSISPQFKYKNDAQEILFYCKNNHAEMDNLAFYRKRTELKDVLAKISDKVWKEQFLIEYSLYDSGSNLH